MNLRNCFGCCFIFFALAGVVRAQNSAQIALNHANLTAGDPLQITITLDKPYVCDAHVEVNFLTESSSQFSMEGTVSRGQVSATLSGNLPRDLPAGEYRAHGGYLYPCPGYMNGRNFTVPPVTVSVRALPDLNQYPTSAGLVLTLTQKQFLSTKIAELGELDSQLTTRLERNASDTSQLRNFLINTVESAEKALDATEDEYSKQVMKSQGSLPAFFADFRAQYQALLTDLRAPIPGNAAQNSAMPDARLVYVRQLVRRPSDGHLPEPENLSNTYPPSATAVRKVITDNSAAYKYVRDTGRITFDAELTSVPPGARIRYKKLIDDVYQDYSSPTDVPHATFELATWIFVFHKDGCTDEPAARIDPYEDTNPDISVEFNHCKGR